MLSANASGGTLQGTITLNGSPRRPAEYRKLCCYVMQRDVLLESATARCLHSHIVNGKTTEPDRCHASEPPSEDQAVLYASPTHTCCCCFRATELCRHLVQVREALVASALLQLPFSMPMRGKLDRVEGIIAELVRAAVPRR